MEQLEIVRETQTTEAEFCACCGNRIAAGTTVSFIRKAINARGRYAHAICVKKYNAKLEAAAAKEAHEKEIGMRPIVRAEQLIRPIKGEK